MSISSLRGTRLILKINYILYTGNNQIEILKIFTIGLKNKKHWGIHLKKDVQGLSKEKYKISNWNEMQRSKWKDTIGNL